MVGNRLVVAAVAGMLCASELRFTLGFSSGVFSAPTRRESMVMRKGRPSLRKTVGGSSGGKANFLGGSEDEAPVGKTNWVPVSGVKSMQDLPTEQNKVQLVETMAQQLINKRTNPSGAVGIANYGGNRTYCVSASCSSCKIPMTKAKLLEPNEETKNLHPRLECDFCGATYNIRTGDVLADGNSKKSIMGGVVKGLFGSKEKISLPTYDLGELGGKVVINLP